MSDHCPIILRDRAIDFGPKPTKVFDEWLEADGVNEIISNAWNKEVHSRRRDCKFRDKLKNIKIALKEWSHNSLGNIDGEVEALKTKAMEWENIAEERVLTTEERNEWLECRKRWIDKDKVKSNMAKQKSRFKWLMDGDENTKFFHSFMKRRYSKRNLRGLNINGTWCEDPIDIKQEVVKHFKSLFANRRGEVYKLQNSAAIPRPQQLSAAQADHLELKFSE
ncbi:uncharacterized protein [Rutidosis leptorrhynchoides]|uniref:uncharacterized protein n=1 Tax=Rutidosis leptorrhynchoides TaxID=125765 RepID=UPI003A9A05A8